MNNEITLIPPSLTSNQAIINAGGNADDPIKISNNNAANFKQYLNITNNTSHLLTNSSGDGDLKYGGSGQNGAIFISW